MMYLRPGGGPGRGGGDLDDAFGNVVPFTTSRPRPQHHLARPLELQEQLKAAIAAWDQSGGTYRMPQLRHFGLRLPDLKPSQITWPGRAA